LQKNSEFVVKETNVESERLEFDKETSNEMVFITQHIERDMK